MNIKLLNKKSEVNLSNLLVFGVYEDFSNLDSLSNEISEYLSVLKKQDKFKANLGEEISAVIKYEDAYKNVLIIGLGKREELKSEKLRKITSKIVRKANELKLSSAELNLSNISELVSKETVEVIAETAILTNYKFDKYKEKKSNITLNEFNLIIGDIEKIDDYNNAIAEAQVLALSTILARDLVNEPANVLNPKELAKRASEAGEKNGFEVEILKEDKIEELGMEAYLSVAKGSDNKPRFIIMRYLGDPDNKEKIFGLVGKGLTFDTGGYSLKPTAGMVIMKSDMGGAAAVIGAMASIAKMRLKANVTAVVAACENMISANSYRPGDIIGSMAGKTIEVLNTDAEGRLTLVDAVHYIISKEKVSKVIDLATLTGAALVALGTTTTAVVSNNEEFYNDLQAASKPADEKVWRLPAFDDYKELIKSDIADLKNIGGSNAGTITAGLFIGEFVKEIPWIHMDIAGTAWSETEHDYISKGGTGVGVRTLYNMIKNYTK